MKKIRDMIESYVLRADNHWKVIPVKRQRLITKFFFAGYVLLTTMVITSICISTIQRSNTIPIQHVSGISKNSLTSPLEQFNRGNSSNKK